LEGNAENEPGGARAMLGADLIIPLLAIALVAYYVVSTDELSWEAKATGVLVGVVLTAMCTIQIVRVLRAAITGGGRLGFGGLLANTPENMKRFGLVGLTAAFIGGVSITGTTLGLFVLLIALMLVMGVREWKTLVLVAFCTAATVYVLLIYLLGSKLPQGPIERGIAALFGTGG
jgi:hypothetical protein